MPDLKSRPAKGQIIHNGYVKKGGVNPGSSANRPNIKPPAQKPPVNSEKK
jgi:hypothetical protein